jgi:hypothetical protein
VYSYDRVAMVAAEPDYNDKEYADFKQRFHGDLQLGRGH